MKNCPFKKTALIVALTAASISFGSIAFADTAPQQPPTNNPPSNGGLIAAIDDLGNKIVALATAEAKSFNSLVYQFDQNMLPSEQANTVTIGKNNYTISQAQNLEANDATQTNINNSLEKISLTVAQPQEGTAEAKALLALEKYNSPQMLSGIKASDTLYSSNPEASLAGVAKPSESELHNNYFNFSTLFNPVSYSQDQLVAANRYLQFTSKDYQPLTDGLNYNALRSLSPKQLAEFMNSPQYQKYQLNVRAMVASRSLALSNFNHMIAERTPIQGLGSVAGLSTANASPLQVKNYIATHRVNSKQWYQEMAAASPATVQRETLFVLAEIEKQNYQAHLDRERLIATMSAMQLTTAQLLQQSQSSLQDLGSTLSTVQQQVSQDADKYSKKADDYLKKHGDDDNGNYSSKDKKDLEKKLKDQ